ncbi:MAG: hypothetical protein ACT4OP_10395 [Actinomycetota bacterium]
MDPNPDPGGLKPKNVPEQGMVTVQFMAVTALSMVFLALLSYLIAVQYASGVVRAALDEGVRVSAPARATEVDCVEAIDRVLEGLMSGPLGEGVAASCVVEGDQVVASATAAFPGWFPGLPAISFDVEVRGVKETDE